MTGRISDMAARLHRRDNPHLVARTRLSGGRHALRLEPSPGEVHLPGRPRGPERGDVDVLFVDDRAGRRSVDVSREPSSRSRPKCSRPTTPCSCELAPQRSPVRSGRSTGDSATAMSRRGRGSGSSTRASPVRSGFLRLRCVTPPATSSSPRRTPSVSALQAAQLIDATARISPNYSATAPCRRRTRSLTVSYLITDKKKLRDTSG